MQGGGGRRRGERREMGGRFVKMDKERQRRKRWKRILGSKYNRWYRCVKGEGVFKERMGRRVGGGEWRGLGWGMK